MMLDFFNTLLEFLVNFLFFKILAPKKIFSWLKLVMFFSISLLFSGIISYFSVLVLPVAFLLFQLSLSFFYYNASVKDGVFNGTVAFLLTLLLQMTLNSFLPLSLLHTDYGNLIVNSLMLIIVTFLWYFSARYHIDSFLSSLVKKHKLFVFIFLFLSTIVCQVYVLQLSVIWQYLPSVIAGSFFFTFLCSLLAYMYYSKQAFREKEQYYKRSIEVTERLVNSCRLQIHNNNSHLNHITGILDTTSSIDVARTSVKNYIGNLNLYHEIPQKILSIEDPLLRSVLYSTYVRCADLSISVDLELSPLLPSFPLKDFELVEVIDNLISNAIDYVRNLPLNNRSIKICLFSDSIISSFSISNPYIESTQEISSFFIPGYTSKSAKHLGIGLPGIISILENHDMSLSTEFHVDTHELAFSFEYKKGRNEE